MPRLNVYVQWVFIFGVQLLLVGCASTRDAAEVSDEADCQSRYKKLALLNNFSNIDSASDAICSALAHRFDESNYYGTACYPYMLSLITNEELAFRMYLKNCVGTETQGFINKFTEDKHLLRVLFDKRFSSWVDAGHREPTIPERIKDKSLLADSAISWINQNNFSDKFVQAITSAIKEDSIMERVLLACKSEKNAGIVIKSMNRGNVRDSLLFRYLNSDYSGKEDPIFIPLVGEMLTNNYLDSIIKHSTNKYAVSIATIRQLSFEPAVISKLGSTELQITITRKRQNYSNGLGISWNSLDYDAIELSLVHVADTTRRTILDTTIRAKEAGQQEVFHSVSGEVVLRTAPIDPYAVLCRIVRENGIDESLLQRKFKCPGH
jgi:hypothetical protein